MRFQSGSTPQQGSQQSAQQGDQTQMTQGDSDARQWPFKPFQYPAEIGVPEFTALSLGKSERRASQPPRRKPGQQSG